MCTSYHGMADDAREWSVFPLFQIFIRTVQKIFQTAGFHLVFTHIPEFHLHILRFFFPAGILLFWFFCWFRDFLCHFSVCRTFCILRWFPCALCCIFRTKI